MVCEVKEENAVNGQQSWRGRSRLKQDPAGTSWRSEEDKPVILIRVVLKLANLVCVCHSNTSSTLCTFIYTEKNLNSTATKAAIIIARFIQTCERLQYARCDYIMYPKSSEHWNPVDSVHVCLVFFVLIAVRTNFKYWVHVDAKTGDLKL